jgi:SAM-dependent methyltransferase
MLLFGVQPRPVRCPRCHSIDRERTVFIFLKQRTNLFRDRLRVLHFAPEPNLRKILRTAPNVDYVTADVYPGRADEQIDITDIPYQDNSFDVVLCVHVLEHVRDDHKALSEILRVLKPGGWALPLVPVKGIPNTLQEPLSTPEQRLAAYGQSDHVRQYGLDYENRLVAAGFYVKITRFEEQFSDAESKKYALLSKDDMYVGVKPHPS